MRDVTIEGVGSIKGGEYGLLSIEGVCKCNGDIQAETLLVEGVFKCFGSIRAGSMSCEGMSQIHGDIKAEKISIEGMMKVSGGTKIEATEITCEGMIELSGEISADRIDSDGFISADEIVGDSINIRSRRNHFWDFFRPHHSRIKLIEATDIELRGVEAQTVNGTNVVIRSGCTIENLDCSGTLFIDPRSQVRNLTGSFTRRDA